MGQVLKKFSNLPITSTEIGRFFLDNLPFLFYLDKIPKIHFDHLFEIIIEIEKYR